MIASRRPKSRSRTMTLVRTRAPTSRKSVPSRTPFHGVTTEPKIPAHAEKRWPRLSSGRPHRHQRAERGTIKCKRRRSDNRKGGAKVVSRSVGKLVKSTTREEATMRTKREPAPAHPRDDAILLPRKLHARQSFCRAKRGWKGLLPPLSLDWVLS